MIAHTTIIHYKNRKRVKKERKKRNRQEKAKENIG
jgi:hypothetical protein